jgi:tetratricopeptide (TPR) repeat protein
MSLGYWLAILVVVAILILGVTSKLRCNTYSNVAVSPNGYAIPPKAIALHEAAREAGAKNEFQKAITLLQQARELAPNWEYPLYDMGWTYLLMGDVTKALDVYERVDQMLPGGFYTTKIAVDSLRREAKGEITKGSYLAYVLSEFEDPAKRGKEILEELVERSPNFPAAWARLASLASDNKKRLEICDKALAMEPDLQTKTALLICKAEALTALGQTDAAQKLLKIVINDPNMHAGQAALVRLGRLGNLRAESQPESSD